MHNIYFRKSAVSGGETSSGRLGRPPLDPEAGPMVGEVRAEYKRQKYKEGQKRKKLSKVRRDAATKRWNPSQLTSGESESEDNDDHEAVDEEEVGRGDGEKVMEQTATEEQEILRSDFEVDYLEVDTVDDGERDELLDKEDEE